MRSLNIARLFLLSCFLVFAAKNARSSRILAIVATPSYSHQIPYRRLWVELNKRGHDVLLVTPNPMNYEAANFTQIDVGKSSYTVLRRFDFVQMRFDGVSWRQFLFENMWDIMDYTAELVYNNTEMKKIYSRDSNATFDVLLTEYLYMPALYAMAHRFDCPIIGLSSLGLLTINEHILGGIMLPSHEYTWEMEGSTGANLSFLKRLQNFLSIWQVTYRIYDELLPRQQNLAEKYLGPLPPLFDIMRNNTSMLFVDQSDVVTAARPKLANMITFTSFHIEDNPEPLPKDLQKFLDEAKNGFIYFSLGSNAMSSSLPANVRQMFCEIFEKLPYRVVWKYEEEFPQKPKNVYTAKWLPQQRILAHPNIKLFIYQGGVQSSEETIHFGVPVIGFPILADQDYQVARMEALGVGKRFDLPTVTKEELESSIVEIITNKEYKERILNLRKLVQDTPYDMVKNLAWWTEYVIRTNGAPHLRSSLAHQPWYQRYDVDIIIFLTFITVLIATNVFHLIVKAIVELRKRLQISNREKQKIS